MEDKEIEVYLVRHGQTIYNLMKKMQGWSDTPLTNQGLPILEETADKLRDTHFDAVYSSDLKRATDTADIILRKNLATNAKLKTSPNFREIFFGAFEGEKEVNAWREIGRPYGITTIEEFRQQKTTDFLRDATKKADEYHLAEDSNEVKVRLQKGLDELLAENENHSKILLTTHGGFIKDLISQPEVVNNTKALGFPSNGSITRIKIKPGRIELRDYNK